MIQMLQPNTNARNTTQPITSVVMAIFLNGRRRIATDRFIGRPCYHTTSLRQARELMLSSSTNRSNRRSVPPGQIIERSTDVSQKIISFHYTLTGPDGKTLDSSTDSEPLTFLEGVGQVIPGLETELSSMKVGYKKHIKVKAKDAYGEKD